MDKITNSEHNLPIATGNSYLQTLAAKAQAIAKAKEAKANKVTFAEKARLQREARLSEYQEKVNEVEAFEAPQTVKETMLHLLALDYKDVTKVRKSKSDPTNKSGIDYEARALWIHEYCQENLITDSQSEKDFLVAFGEAFDYANPTSTRGAHNGVRTLWEKGLVSDCLQLSDPRGDNPKDFAYTIRSI